MDIPRPSFTIPELSKGTLLGLKTRPIDRKTNFSLYFIYILLYVDDAAMIFSDRVLLLKGTHLLFRNMARWGLEMHIGREGTPSKSECVFFIILVLFRCYSSPPPACYPRHSYPVRFDHFPYPPKTLPRNPPLPHTLMMISSPPTTLCHSPLISNLSMAMYHLMTNYDISAL